MKRSYVDFLQDILDNAQKAERFVEGVDFDSFADNEEKIYAVVHALQTVGEAARNLPKSVRRRYPATPWDDIIGMRDIVIHEYFSVDLEVIWKTIKKDLVPLKDAVKKMLADLAEEEGEDK